MQFDSRRGRPDPAAIQTLSGLLDMDMAQGDSERVAGVRLKFALQTQKDTYHMLDLALFGASAADQGLFDLPGRIFINRKLMRDHGANRGPAGLSELQGRIGILMHKDLFNRELVGTVFPNHRADAFKDLFQSLGEGFPGHPHASARNIAQTAGRIIDYPEPGDPRPRIDA